MTHNQSYAKHLTDIHDHEVQDPTEDMYLVHSIYYPNCLWVNEPRRTKVHVDCAPTSCMLGDPTPCILFAQEIDAEDLVPGRSSNYVPDARQVKHLYEHFVRALTLLNQNVPEGERIMVPFILQGVLAAYIEEREAIESIQKSAQA